MEVDGDEPFIKNGGLPVLIIQSADHALNVFINGDLVGICSFSIKPWV